MIRDNTICRTKRKILRSRRRKKKDIKLVKKLKKIHDPSTKFSIFRKRREERGGKTEVFHAIGRVPKAGEENRQVCSETGSL